MTGTYKPIIDKEYAFSEVQQAYERQMSGRYVPSSPLSSMFTDEISPQQDARQSRRPNPSIISPVSRLDLLLSPFSFPRYSLVGLQCMHIPPQTTADCTRIERRGARGGDDANEFYIAKGTTRRQVLNDPLLIHRGKTSTDL